MNTGTQNLLDSSPSDAISNKTVFIGGTKFDIIFLIASFWLLCGTFLDAWAHNNIPRLETFWTPWHAVLYSGVLVVLVTLSIIVVTNHHRGQRWHEAVPQGYFLSLLGAYEMILVGAGDALWHTFFGVEKNIDAAFSPTHLGAMICISLVLAGPLRSLLSRGVNTSQQLLFAFAFLEVYAMVCNISQPFSVYTNYYPLTHQSNSSQILAAACMILQAIILTGFVLYLIKEKEGKIFGKGFFTIVLTLTGTGLSVMQQHYLVIIMGLLSGLSLDFIYWWLKPSINRIQQLRWFAACIAALPNLFYVGVLFTYYGHLAWTIHMSLGSVFVTGVFGWFLSYLIAPAKQTYLPTKE